MLKKSAWLLHLIGDNAPPIARDIVVRLHMRKINAVILTPETAGTTGV